MSVVQTSSGAPLMKQLSVKRNVTDVIQLKYIEFVLLSLVMQICAFMERKIK
jgi:hypothetical protein